MSARRTRARGGGLAATALALATSCGGDPLPRAEAPELDTGQAKCQVAASDANPLVTEWPASEKANLEMRLREGGVPVAYSGCELRLVTDCNLGGRYFWQRTTVATDAFEVRSADDLYAKLPLGAVSLEGELSRSGRLAMRTTVSGQLRLTEVSLTPQGEGCQTATHVISAMSVGAFTLRSGGALGVKAGADTPMGGVGAGTKSEETVMREAGDPGRCAQASDHGADPQCASPIQLFLVPIQSLAYAAAKAPPPPATTPPATPPPPPTAPPTATAAPPPTATATAAPPPPVTAAPPPPPTAPPPTAAPPPRATAAPPPAATATTPPPTGQPWLPPAPTGTLGPGVGAGGAGQRPGASLVLNVRSGEQDASFTIRAGGETLCATPCRQRVRADDLVEIVEIGATGREPMVVPDLRAYVVNGGVDVTAYPRATGEFIGGVLLSAGGGIGLMAGMIALFLGSSSTRGSTAAQVAGGITMGAGAAMIAPGVILILGHREYLEVTPSEKVDLSVGPGYLRGSF